MLQIKLKHRCEKYPLSNQFHPFSYEQGEIVPISKVNYPGEPKETGSIPYILDKGNSRPPMWRTWIFWVTRDVKDPILFEQGDVDEIYIDDEIDNLLLAKLRQQFKVNHHAPVGTGG